MVRPFNMNLSRSVDEKRYQKLRSDAEATVLSNAEVISCTCITAGSAKVAKLTFQAILVRKLAKTQVDRLRILWFSAV